MAYCLDFNERCSDVQYALECLGQIRARSPEAFERIIYIEQPTARDLQATGTTSCTKPRNTIPW